MIDLRNVNEVRVMRSALELLGKRGRRRLVGLTLAMAVAAVAELVGVGVIFIFIHLHADPIAAAQTFPVAALLGIGIPMDVLTGVTGGVLFALFYLAKTGLTAGCYFSMLRFTYGESERMGAAIYRRYSFAPFLKLASRNTAELMRNAHEEVQRAYVGVVSPFVFLLSNLFMAAGLFALMVVLEPSVTMAAFGLVGGLALAFYAFYRRVIARKGAERQHLARDRLLWLRQGLDAHREIRLLGRQNFFIDRYTAALHRSIRAELLVRLLDLLPRLTLELVLVIGAIAAMLVLQLGSQNLQEALPVIGALAFASVRLLGIVNSIIGQLQQISFAGPSIITLQRELRDFPDESERQRQPEPTTGTRESEAVEQAPGGGANQIVFDNVSFAYPSGDRSALQDVELSFPIGASVAFVGPSGAGKSTLANLLLGLIEPDQGIVLVDGEAVHADLPTWFPKVGYVPQQIYLLDDTIANNVALGLPPDEIDRDRVRETLRIAQLQDFVSNQPLGIDQPVGENGVQISGGERQRIGIARAIYRDPAILVLDEATSALDNVTERRFVDAISAVSEGRTLIVIAHRISTVRNCDLICYMEHGRVLEVGSYAQLFNSSDRFRRMVQSSLDEVGNQETTVMLRQAKLPE